MKDVIGYEFRDESLLNLAFTHCSIAVEKHCEHNQRLEFLGDAVLELIVSDYLYTRKPQLSEGMMTKARAAVVAEASLSEVAIRLDLGSKLILGKGEELSGGRQKPSILADTVEALIGAIYLDSGMDSARKFVLREFKSALEEALISGGRRDYKTTLQETLQAQSMENCEYVLISEEGPAHEKLFEVEVRSGSKALGRGRGRSKKDAQQKAAEAALNKLQ